MAYKLLIINPGSTSTKIGVYSGEKEVLVETLRHSSDEIAKYDTIFDQKGFRKEVIMNVLKENNIDVNSLFNKFYTADKSRNKGSSGLGLYIVKELLKKIDGKIENVSYEGNILSISIQFCVV